MRKNNCLLLIALVVLVLTASDSILSQEAANFKDFSAQVQQYMKLHHDADSSLPPLRNTTNPEALVTRGQLLAGKIRDLRPNARRGEIFTEQASVAFRKAISNILSASAPRTTLQAGDPVTGFKIEVNQIYPKGLPLTTVPPSLLVVLPKLPDELEYRIAGADLLLLDIPASLIIDFIPDAIPQPAG
jgi:hypothetical protein